MGQILASSSVSNSKNSILSSTIEVSTIGRLENRNKQNKNMYIFILLQNIESELRSFLLSLNKGTVEASTGTTESKSFKSCAGYQCWVWVRSVSCLFTEERKKGDSLPLNACCYRRRKNQHLHCLEQTEHSKGEFSISIFHHRLFWYFSFVKEKSLYFRREWQDGWSASHYKDGSKQKMLIYDMNKDSCFEAMPVEQGTKKV